ncbi:carboxypeptidase-like regulatory domain-containing protein [Paludibacter sp.]|uniref:carboxypeptidase-like regulatory domain-containing protein n=1 Tax=Paludibacter sp. TaxID=1898105 RepID=UPI00135311BC|nr:carboxypeptidase-like regulatory domain-containing protein [Paludibacter sp.]MTK52945.1 carboxypeptidase regulatory-like domain-containing protein [Paludibacter sp.]
MTNLQIQKMRMYQTLRVLFKANPGMLAKLPNVNEFLTELDAVILQIEANSKLQQQGTSDLTDYKTKLHDNLKQDVLDASRKVQPYAVYTKDSALQKATKYTESDLNRLLDVELIQVAKGLYDKVNAQLPNLAPYGLTDDTQATFLKDIMLYETAIPEIKKGKLDQKNVTTQLGENFDSANEIIDNLDLLVEIVRNSDPQFYADYQNLRKVEPSYSTVQLRAKVKDATTEMPIANVKLSFTYNGNSKPEFVKQTAAKGGIMVRSMAEGIYTIAINKIGYQPQTITATVASDALCSLDIKLVKS